MEEKKTSIKEKLIFPFKLIIRPFKGFDFLKENVYVSKYLSYFFVFLYGILSILEYQHTGFLFNENNPYELNALIILVVTISPLVLFVVANWSLTVFLDGKGKFNEIFKTLSYSLLPFLMARIINLIISNFITNEEKMFIEVIFWIGLLWTFYCLFIGMVIIHEYSFSTNIINILLTIFIFIILIFLILLFFNLIQILFGFSESFISEIIYRIRGY